MTTTSSCDIPTGLNTYSSLCQPTRQPPSAESDQINQSCDAASRFGLESITTLTTHKKHRPPLLPCLWLEQAVAYEFRDEELFLDRLFQVHPDYLAAIRAAFRARLPCWLANRPAPGEMWPTGFLLRPSHFDVPECRHQTDAATRSWDSVHHVSDDGDDTICFLRHPCARQPRCPIRTRTMHSTKAYARMMRWKASRSRATTSRANVPPTTNQGFMCQFRRAAIGKHGFASYRTNGTSVPACHCHH